MPRQPKTLTKDELQEDNLIFSRDSVFSIPPDMLSLLDAELVKLEGWGVNPARVRIADFDSALVVSPLDQIPGLPASPDFVSMVFKHHLTGKVQNGIGVAVPSHFPTAVTLTQLAVPNAKK